MVKKEKKFWLQLATKVDKLIYILTIRIIIFEFHLIYYKVNEINLLNY